MNPLTSTRVGTHKGRQGLGSLKPGGWLGKLLVASLLWISYLLVAIPAMAEEGAPSQLRLLLLLMDPLDPEVFSRNSEAVYPHVITSSDVSQVGLTIPSLWWVDEQFGDRLLENWAAFPAEDGLPPRVDLMVNEQVWSIYQPIERYAFVNQFGTSAQDYGYITRVYDRRNDLLAAYLCDYQGDGTAVQLQDRCDLFLNWAGGPSLPDTMNSQNASSANTPSRFRR
ncbi:MAG: hypothetical protein AAFY26_00405 [Cyanobacteria bacterium J06638_22]